MKVPLETVNTLLAWGRGLNYRFSLMSNERITTKHYENMPIQIYWKFYNQKMKIFRKKIWYFHISAENIDCRYLLEPPRRGGSNEYLQSMFLSRNKKNNVYPCEPQFYYIKEGFKGVKIICFSDVNRFYLQVEALHRKKTPELLLLLYSLTRSNLNKVEIPYLLLALGTFYLFTIRVLTF